MRLTLASWQDALRDAAAALDGDDEQGAAEALTVAVVRLLGADRVGRLLTRRRMKRVARAYRASGRSLIDLA